MNESEDWYQHGMTALQAGLLPEAVSAFDKAIQLAPNQPKFHKSMGDVQAATGNQELAMSAYRRAVSLDADYFQAHANLGNVLSATGFVAEAIEHFKKAVNLRPDIAELHDSLGLALLKNNKSIFAELAFRHALRLKPELATAHNNLGKTLELAGHLDEAERHYRHAIKLAPDLFVAFVGLSSTLLQLGGCAEAKSLLAMLPEKFENMSKVRQLYARIAMAESDYEKALEILHRLLTVEDISVSGKSKAYRLIAEASDKQGNYLQAFEYYQQANALKPDVFDQKIHAEFIEKKLNLYSREMIEKSDTDNNASTIPVFILGMPRAGKTMTAKLLSAHPQIAAVDERLSLASIFLLRSGRDDADLVFEAPLQLTQGILDEMASDYLQMAKEYLTDLESSMREDPKYIVSARPGDIFELGLLHRMFPSAPVIHVRRYPLDTCLECYFKSFASPHHAYSNDLQDLAFYYRQYERMISHWRDELGIPMLEICYEDLVSQTGKTMRSLHEYLGIEPGMGAQQKAFAETLSLGGIGRWKNYQEQLQPLIEILGETAEYAS